ncbi:MAG: hypothetical protein N2322_00580, partial [Terrimicrobiaceae bacterium]|nr:hypothetical protein [Terrimicrobiaceae bacterium]
MCRVLDELRLLYKIASILQESADVPHLLPAILAALESQTDFFRCSLRIVNRASSSPEIAAATGLPPLEISKNFEDFDLTLSSKVCETGSAWLLPLALPISRAAPAQDLHLLPKSSFSKTPGILLCVPVSLESQTLGVLSVASRPASHKVVTSQLRLLGT